jgi:hypothetical protein
MRMRLLLPAMLLLAFLTGCTTDGRLDDSTPPVKVAKGGAQLWAENCRRCHALRPPTAFSDNEWDVIVNHMRTRAHLTADESRKISEFLKAAN